MAAPTKSPAKGFTELGLDKWLVDSLSAMAIRKPTPIQAACIGPILEGKDCIGISHTGSGKTLSFAAPILHLWSHDPTGTFALILTPTRELALQTTEHLLALGSPQSLRVALLIGGADMRTQALTLSTRPHIVVATPGRLADHIASSGEDTICTLRRCRFVVLDEADRLLSESFAGDLETCLSVVPPAGKTGRQTLLFTATATEELDALRDAKRPGGREVVVCAADPGVLAVPEKLRERYILLVPYAREAYLHALLSTAGNEGRSCIVFANRAETAELLGRVLRGVGHRVTALHSGMRQRERIDSLGRFRAGAARILVATDVAGRGLDIPVVEMVVNFDVPRDPDDYVHRVGRTARAGRGGEAVTFVTGNDVKLVEAIEARTGRKMGEYVDEPGVSLEGRVVRELLQVVSEVKRSAVVDIGEGRNENGKRRRKGGEKGKKKKREA